MEDKIDFSKLFEVDPTSPTGLKWRDDINNGITGRGKNLHAGKPAGVKKAMKGRTPTIHVLIKGKVMVVSRVIWELVHGEISDGMIIDHLDGNPFNNKIENLEPKTRAGNMKNRKRNINNKSGIPGVRLIKAGSHWVSSYQDENKKAVKKSFSVSKYGDDEAFRLAVEFRMNGLKLMNEILDHKYTERHITGELV